MAVSVATSCRIVNSRLDFKSTTLEFRVRTVTKQNKYILHMYILANFEFGHLIALRFVSKFPLDDVWIS